MDFLRQNKKFIPVGTVLIGILIFSLIGFLGFKTPAYNVYIDGEKKIIAERPEEVNKALETIIADQNKQSPCEVELCGEVGFERVFVNKRNIVPQEDLQNELLKVLNFKSIASAIFVDGEQIACVESKDLAEGLLNKLKEEYSQVDEGEELIEVRLAEDVEIKVVKVAKNEIMAAEKVYELIKTGTDNPEKYTVNDGDSLWLIARKNDMYVDDIVRANQLKTNKLSPGQELVLVKSKPYINVLAEVKGEKSEEIPYETEVIVDKNAGTSIKIKQEGQDGERHISYVATKCNGLIEAKEVKEETILKEAIKKIIVKGSGVSQIASRGGGGSGILAWPVYGVLTQYYKGSSHTGIDIGSSKGTALKAADSGYVTFAGYKGNYGNFVIIDHGNGIVTRYAHCNSINVSVGQEVSKGETIATMGSTGRSSGPHLHFEVRVNNTFQNPLNYLR